MAKYGHKIINRTEFEVSETEFGGRLVESIEHRGCAYIKLKDVTDSVGYFAAMSKVSGKIKEGGAVRVYQSRKRFTYVKLDCVGELIEAIRGSSKMQHVIVSGTVRGNGKPLSAREMRKGMLAFEAAAKSIEQEEKIAPSDPISRIRAEAYYKERALVRRFGVNRKGVKFRYVKRMRSNKDYALSVKDYMPARFEGNINLAS